MKYAANIPKARIVGMVVVGPGEGGRYLTECLRGLNPLVDAVCIVLNNPDPETERIILRAERSKPRYVWRDDREWGKCQNLIKDRFLRNVARHTGAEWVIAVDADEVLQVNRSTVEMLARQPFEVGYYFWCLDLWDYPDYYREDFTFDDVRMFRIDRSRPLRYKSTPLHCGMAPEYAYNWGSHLPFAFLHYGLMKRKDRERRYERYKKYDPAGVYHPQGWYDALLAKNASIIHIDEFPMKADGMAFRSKGAPKPKADNEPTVGYAFLTRHGNKVVVTDEKTRDFYKTNPRTYEYLGEEPIINAGGEAEVPEDEPEEVDAFKGKEPAADEPVPTIEDEDPLGVNGEEGEADVEDEAFKTSEGAEEPTAEEKPKKKAAAKKKAAK